MYLSSYSWGFLCDRSLLLYTYTSIHRVFHMHSNNKSLMCTFYTQKRVSNRYILLWNIQSTQQIFISTSLPYIHQVNIQREYAILFTFSFLQFQFIMRYSKLKVRKYINSFMRLKKNEKQITVLNTQRFHISITNIYFFTEIAFKRYIMYEQLLTIINIQKFSYNSVLRRILDKTFNFIYDETLI